MIKVYDASEYAKGKDGKPKHEEKFGSKEVKNDTEKEVVKKPVKMKQ